MRWVLGTLRLPTPPAATREPQNRLFFSMGLDQASFCRQGRPGNPGIVSLLLCSLLSGAIGQGPARRLREKEVTPDCWIVEALKTTLLARKFSDSGSCLWDDSAKVLARMLSVTPDSDVVIVKEQYTSAEGPQSRNGGFVEGQHGSVARKSYGNGNG